MTLEELNQSYSESLFTKLNSHLIGNAFSLIELSVAPDNGKFISNAKYFGNYADLDLHVLAVEHSGSEEARVGVSLEIFKLMKKYSFKNALVAAYPKGSNSWRYSLVTSNLSVNDKGKISKDFSNPRRYSFVLGENQKVLTPFKQLVQLGTVQNLEELSKRFSLEVVNNEFYKEISKLFDSLVGTDKILRQLKYPKTGDESHEFAVRLIGRIIFCWFLREKKSKAGIPLVPIAILSREASNLPNYYHSVLAPLFFEVLNKQIPKRSSKFKNGDYGNIPYLNGGLFNDDNIDYYKFDKVTENSIPALVDVPDSWLREFFDLLERFNFTVDENTAYDTDLSIDPEMLGRVFENLLARINPETGETVRRSTGSFYTPREIVDYMVDASLSEYLSAKTGIAGAKLNALLSYDLLDDAGNELSEVEKVDVLRALSTLTALDPACGSGAFPIGMLQKLVFIITNIDPDAEWWLAKQLEGASPELRREFTNRSVDYVRKLGIIRQTIFGVDIQPIATEISRLRCFLTLIVDETIDETQENRGIRPLPNLDFKFVTANTLIPLPKPEDKKGEVSELQSAMFEERSHIDELKQIRSEYFSSTNYERTELQSQFDRLQKKMVLTNMDVFRGSASKLYDALARWEPFEHKLIPWFDPDWIFGVEVGFDIVIGNPPYVQLQKNGGELATIYENKHYETFARMGDIYCLFYEQGVNLLGDKGVLAYISSNKWMKAAYGKLLRKYLASRTQPLTLLDFSGFNVFESATVDTCVIVATKRPMSMALSAAHYSASKFNRQSTLGSYFNENKIDISPSEIDKSGEKSWVIAEKSGHNLRKKIEQLGVPLKNWDIGINYGIKTGCNEAFIIDESTRTKLISEDPRSTDIIKPILRGRDIKRYLVEYQNLYLISTFPSLKIDIDRYPAVKAYLEQFGKDKLEQSGRELGDGKKARKKTGNKWFETQDPIKYYKEFDEEKIAWGNLTLKSQFALVDKGILVNAPSVLITPASSYLLGVLNSKLGDYYIRQQGVTRNGGYVEYKPMFVQKLPVPLPSEPNQNLIDAIESEVQSALIARKTGRIGDAQEHEKRIDGIVYELYELAPNDVAEIEQTIPDAESISEVLFEASPNAM